MSEAVVSAPGSAIGARVVRFDGADKVTGQAQYVGDIVLPGMLHAVLLLAEHPHARIRRIDTADAEAVPGVQAVVSYRDVPDVRYGPVVKDQRLFVPEGGKVTYVGDVIAGVAAISREIAQEAARHIHVEYEVLEPVLDPEMALAPDAPLVHPEIDSYGALEGTIKSGNDCGYTRIVKGDVAKGFAEADTVIKERYRIDHSHPAAIETHGVVARVDAMGRATVWSSTQVPYMARAGIAETLKIPISKIRVVVPTLGGGFGGKCEFGFEAHAVALAQKSRRPVRLILGRKEEFIAPTMTRHGAIVTIETGVKRDGTMTARRAAVVLDTGGNATHGPTVSEIATMMAVGPYRIPHLVIEGHAVYTNKTSAGSVRAPSGPQVCWAVEQHTDSLALALDMDPFDFRMKNLVEQGDSGPTGQVFEPIGAKDCLRRAAELIDWNNSGTRAGERPLDRRSEGIGLSCGWWFSMGASSAVSAKLNDDGTVTVLTGAQENGSGAVQGLLQIVASEMRVPFDDISIVYQDTDVGGWDAGSQGSQTVFNVGRALREAMNDLKEQIKHVVSEMLEVAPNDLEFTNRSVRVRGAPSHAVTLADIASRADQTVGPLLARGAVSAPEVRGEIPPGCAGRVQFPAFLAPTFCAHAARVSVDQETGVVTVLEAAAAQEVGRAINPVGIEGQMEGGLVHGIGNALSEHTQFVGGHTLNPGFLDYKLMTAADAPVIKTAFVETPSAEGPYGARGVGEPPVVAIAGAIGNALRAATGAHVTHMPMTPDRVHRVIRSMRQER